MIEIAGLSVRFGKTDAVKSLSFDVQRGESFGIVGEFRLRQIDGAARLVGPQSKLDRPDVG